MKTTDAVAEEPSAAAPATKEATSAESGRQDRRGDSIVLSADAGVPIESRHGARDPVVLGTLLCVVSAVGYTATNIFLRDLSTHADPFWVSCVKAMPTVAIALCMLAGRRMRRLPIGISWSAFGSLVAVALFAQLCGNAAFQWTLQIVGIALAVPITHGTMMIGGAVAGRIWLGEPVTPRAAAAMLVLIVAITVLTAGAGDAHAAIEVAGAFDDPLHVARGVAMACVSGIAYAMLGVVIRRVSRGRFPVSTMLLVVCGVGVVSLGVTSLVRLGWDGIVATTAHDWMLMLLAGIFNAAAFFALSKALRLVNVVHVNLVNASQVAMAALAGVALFNEAWTMPLGCGIALTILGLLVMRGRERPGEE